jgi:hypothetical protein
MSNSLSILDNGNMPNLHEAKPSPVDLASEYWSPEVSGDYKVGVAVSIENSTYHREETGEEIELPCVIFVEQTKEGDLKAIRNGSKRLVATIERAIEAGQIELGKTFLRVTYLGKQKNSTNSYSSDRWSVKPIII